ncbi:MAG: DUF3800 domain-containing protein, partial [Chloroflexi bacterium]|nr:DUF3800 domain-containing protein [Chloroflexota bacterium]
RNYFVDEAGDGTLFSRRGRVIIGKPGCSRFFILGLLDIPNPERLSQDFENLRAKLLTDPYFDGVPSMQPEVKKTAHLFHAKNDLPEIRREVFTLLRSFNDLRCFAIVADKRRVLQYVQQRNQRSPSYRYNSNELYDYLTRRLFKDRLHKDSGYNIYFAKRGQSDRTAALYTALEMARKNFEKTWGISSDAPINTTISTPLRNSGLQAIDYFLWALQRLYERGEDRYVKYLWPAFRLVHDIDDNRVDRYGVYYTQKKPLTSATLEPR